MGYEFSYYADYDYSRLKKIRALRRLGKGHEGEFYSNCIMMLDTETSAKSERICEANHIVAWTLSIRAKHENICTLWGKRSFAPCFIPLLITSSLTIPVAVRGME